jgi:tetratricopeptide (TPR) repeat protein
MQLPKVHSAIVTAGILLAAILASAPLSFAQYGGSNAGPPPAQLPAPKAAAQEPAQAPADPEEDKAYKAFTDVKPDAFDQQIQVGEGFLQKYSTGRYAEQVYARLTNAYFQKQQLDKMYAAGDKALSINPDDLSVLVLVGWVIPHNYDPNDPESDRRLAKAATYEKHALELLATLKKPDNVTDEQFAKSKAAALAQAHAGLGLVYFRQQDLPNSVSEMQKAIEVDPSPDQVNYYVLGVGLNSMKRYTEAVDAFQKCSQMPGPVQDRCKQREGEAKKLAAQPAPAK